MPPKKEEIHTNHLFMMCAAMFVYDSPYGLLNESWDHQITVEEVVNIIGQVVVSQRTFNHPCVAVVYHKPRDTDIILTALEKHKFQQFQHIYWYKGKQHSTPTPVRSYTNSVEMITLGFFPDIKKTKWNMDKDPRKRQNIIRASTPSDMVKDTSGKVVNPTQKPRAIMRKIIEHHLVDGDTVLVVGAGAGGDVLGCLDAGVNVVAVESDPWQYGYLQATLEKENERSEGGVVSEPDDGSEEEVQGTQSQAPAVQSSAAVAGPNSSSVASQPPLKCIDCGAKDAVAGDDARECHTCSFSGPLCTDCSVKVPGTDDWWCISCAPKDLQPTQQA